MSAANGGIAPLIANALAPAVMVSYCGLLILGLQNRYSNVVSRIRNHNRERLELAALVEMPTYEAERFTIITLQLQRLLIRCRLIRNAILSIFLAVLFFLGAAILSLIGTTRDIDLSWWTLASFGFGLSMTVISMIFATVDILRSYRIIAIEVQAKSKTSLAEILTDLFKPK